MPVGARTGYIDPRHEAVAERELDMDNTTILWIVIGVVVLIAIIAIIYAVTRHNGYRGRGARPMGRRGGVSQRLDNDRPGERSGGRRGESGTTGAPVAARAASATGDRASRPAAAGPATTTPTSGDVAVATAGVHPAAEVGLRPAGRVHRRPLSSAGARRTFHRRW